MTDLPGGEIASRPLHFIWVLDTSTSMSGAKIGMLNAAVRECIGPMRDTAKDNPNAKVLVRAVTFSSGARWHVATPTPVESFTWKDVQADGVTDTGRALALVADQLKMPPMSPRALPPVLVLITDGYPTDDFDTGLKRLMDEPWGKRAVRIAIGVGQGTDLDHLAKFIGHDEIAPLEAGNADALVKYMRWVSTAVVKSTSMPLSRGQQDQADRPGYGPPPPALPPLPPVDDDGSDVW